MKFAESRIKSFIYTFLVYFLVIAEMGVLSGFRFASGAADKYGIGLTMEKVTTLGLVGKNVGWNFVVCSFIIILGLFLFAMYMGYNRNPGGMLALVVLNLLPFIGLGFSYNFFYGYGTAQFIPAMSVFGLHMGPRSGQIAFILIVTVLTVAFWFVGRMIRASHARKYEYDV